MTGPEARIQALEALYASDATGEPPLLDDLSARARRMVEGVVEQVVALDDAIAAVARGWRVERMPAVDRNVLRVAVYELRHTDTPVAVVISEAVEIAKTYSTERSGRFVNGVLGALVETESRSG